MSTPDIADTQQSAWPRFLIVALGLAGLAFSVQFVQGVSGILAPVFLALNLVIVVYPVQAALIRQKVPSFIAAMVTTLLVMLLLAAFFGLTGWAIAELVIIMPNYVDQLTSLYNELLAQASTLGLTPAVIQTQLESFNMSSVVNTALAVLSNASTVVTLLTTVAMAVFFLAMDSMSFPQRMKAAGVLRPEFSAAMSSFSLGVRRYWVVATVFGLIVAALDVVALWTIGVPLALVWGVLAFLTNYIPNVGFVIGLLPPALMGLINGGWWDALWVIIAYSVLNFVIQSLIQPKFTGESVGVTPFMSFLSLLFWYWVLGPLGALLALPATLFVKALLVDADPRARWINTFIASDLTTGAGLPIKSRTHVPVSGREVVIELESRPGDPNQAEQTQKEQ